MQNEKEIRYISQKRKVDMRMALQSERPLDSTDWKFLRELQRDARLVTCYTWIQARELCLVWLRAIVYQRQIDQTSVQGESRGHAVCIVSSYANGIRLIDPASHE
jgi:hypothetical protein